MKKRLLKSTVAVAAVASMTLTSILPYQPTKVVKANETVTTPAVSAPVQFIDNNDGTYTFGNSLLKRTFSLREGLFKTEKLINSVAKNELVPATGSEEFVITTLDNGQGEQFKEPKDIIAQEQSWKAEADSVTGREGTNGPAQLIFDGQATTYYHSSYDTNHTQEKRDLPHYIFIDLGSDKTMKSFSYHKRINNGNPTENGHMNEFEIQKFTSYEACKDMNQNGEVVARGNFPGGKNKAVEYANFNGETTARYLRLKVISAHNAGDANKGVTSIGELNFYRDEAVFPKDTIKASELKAQKPVFDDVNNTLTVPFDVVTVRGVPYTIKAIYTMKDGESFMRKHLDISVPKEQAANAKIDYIDLENMNFAAKDTDGTIGRMDGNFWTIPNQPDNPDMSGQHGKYLELGQPYYVGAMYWGCEFPVAENKIRNKNGVNNGFIRYHYGKNLSLTSENSDGQFNYYKNYNGANGVTGKMVTWDAVVGAARSSDYQVCQADFYDYIETIATKTEFRQQFNSWYDNMKAITNTNILESFAEVEKGFTQYGVNPLDSYVVDDGWQTAGSLWQFNEKFPNQLYDSSLQVHQMGSNFGLWLGPRGGYGETVAPLVNYLIANNKGSKNERQNDANISDSRYLDGLTNEVFIPYQEKFDINYWKLDGMLWAPSRNPANAAYHVVGNNDLYTVSETYERWTDMYERMRDQRKKVNGDLWINMTSYANPSPWFLQWVNSLWMQNTGDSGFKYHNNASDQQAMLTYRDGDYYDFFHENQWQLPNKYFYNHDPVYAKTAHSAPGGTHLINYSTKELREHLYMLGTRGTAFWEYYYSPSMFDKEKWQVNAESAKWIEENFHILQKSKMFGGNPEPFDNGTGAEVYGYSCWDGDEGIVSIRNPKNVRQTYKLKYDRLIGVPENLTNVYGKVIIGDETKYQNDTPLSYNAEKEFVLEPFECLIIQYGKKDTLAAKVNSIHTVKNKVDVEFNETIREVTPAMFTVAGFEVSEAQLQADRRTVTLTLNKEVDDLKRVNVTVKGVQDTVGNKTEVTYADEYYKDDVICSVVNVDAKGDAIVKDQLYSVDGNKGFSVVGEISTNSTDVVLAEQKDAFKVGIDANGYLTFAFNKMTVNSKYSETLMKAGQPVETTKGVINDGKKHTFAAVKEVNGMIKLYIDGKVVASKYTKDNLNPNLVKGNVSFAKGLNGHISSLSLLDKALAFDEISSYTGKTENVALASKGATITAFDKKTNAAASVNPHKQLTNIIDGNKSQDNYGELTDTNDGKHSRYIEITLKDSYELDKINLIRYSKDRRQYGATVVALYEASDKNFTNPKIVYSSDKQDVHGLGTNGTEEYYWETAQGKEIDLTNVDHNTKVIRVYVNGRGDTNQTHDHIVELEAFGKKLATIPTKIDYSNLQALVNADFKGYTPASVEAYKTAAKTSLDEANRILQAKNETTTANIDRLVADLTAKQKQHLVKAVNKAELVKQLTNAKAIKNTNDKYTAASFAKLTTAITNASEVNNNSNATQAQVNEQVDALQKAMEALVRYKYVITIQAGDTPIEQYGVYNHRFTCNAPLERDGKTFVGWYKVKADGSEVFVTKANNVDIYVSSDAKYVAKYIAAGEQAPVVTARAEFVNKYISEKDGKLIANFVGELVVPEGKTLKNVIVYWTGKDNVNLPSQQSPTNNGAVATTIHRVNHNYQFSMAINNVPTGRTIRAVIVMELEDSSGIETVYSEVATLKS